jgi:RNase P/RNase MRP subunit p30
MIPHAALGEPSVLIKTTDDPEPQDEDLTTLRDKASIARRLASLIAGDSGELRLLRYAEELEVKLASIAAAAKSDTALQ